MNIRLCFYLCYIFRYDFYMKFRFHLLDHNVCNIKVSSYIVSLQIFLLSGTYLKYIFQVCHFTFKFIMTFKYYYKLKRVTKCALPKIVSLFLLVFVQIFQIFLFLVSGFHACFKNLSSLQDYNNSLYFLLNSYSFITWIFNPPTFCLSWKIGI